MHAVEYLSRKSRGAILFIGMVLVLYVGAIDFVTGPMVAMLVFYLAPICFVAWFAGRWQGLVTALTAGLVWYAAKLMDPDSISRPYMLLWNFFMRVGVFFVLSAVTTEVAVRKRAEEALRLVQQGLETRARELAASEAALRQQTSILQSILKSMGDGVIVMDANGKLILFNPAAERLIGTNLAGKPVESWLGQHETYLTDTLTAYPTNEHPLLRAIRGEIIDGAEIYLRHSDSSSGVWLRATGRPLIGEDQTIRGGVIVFSDITSRKLMEKQIAEISDREQRRIGQDLHDSLCQHLVSTAFAVEFLRDKLSRENAADAARADGIAEMVTVAITQARHLARGLYPVRLEVDGLSSALEELASNTQSRININCHFSCDDPVLIYDEVAGNNLYRIAQEAINNAIKHSQCHNISVGLGAVEDEVTLTVKDDGIGFPETIDAASGMGLHIMNYRARMIGASLDIRRGAGGGTIVICSFHNENVVERRHVLAHKN